MGTFFRHKAIGSTSKKLSDYQFISSLTYYFEKYNKPSEYKDGYVFPAYKIEGCLYYILKREQMDEYEIPNELIQDKMVFYGKTIYLIAATEADPFIIEYEQKNEMILW